MKKVNAELRISVDVDCPWCDELIDLTKINKFADSGFIYKEVLEGDSMGCKDLGEEATCPKCGEAFEIGSVEW